MCPKSSPIPLFEYHSYNIVRIIACNIGEKPPSTDCDNPCRADTPKERSNEVAGKIMLLLLLSKDLVTLSTR